MSGVARPGRVGGGRGRVPCVVRPGRVGGVAPGGARPRAAAQHLRLRRPQGGAGLQAQLRHERRAHPAVDGQRVGLPVESVQRPHELRGRALPRGIGRHQRRELRHRPLGTAEGELGVGELLDATAAQLLQPVGLVAGERPSDARVRRSPPQRERRRRPLRDLGGRPHRDQPLEGHGVHLDVDDVAPAGGADQLARQLAPEASDRAVHHRRGRRRRAVTPDEVDELLDGDRATDAAHQRGQHDRPRAAPDPHGAQAVDDHQLTEHAAPHLRSMTARSAPDKASFTLRVRVGGATVVARSHSRTTAAPAGGRAKRIPSPARPSRGGHPSPANVQKFLNSVVGTGPSMPTWVSRIATDPRSGTTCADVPEPPTHP